VLVGRLDQNLSSGVCARQGCGEVCSMGAVILQAADRRELMPNSIIMLHPGYSSVVTPLSRIASYCDRHLKGFPF